MPTLYAPPTMAGQPTLVAPSPTAGSFEPEIVESSSPPPAIPACDPGLIFLDDISIPDGSIVAPGEELDKRWLVENSGSCNWDQRFSLQLIAGPDMGVQSGMALFPARSGTQAEINILFTAPAESGLYRSAWQARDPEGNLFGDPIYIEVIVQNP